MRHHQKDICSTSEVFKLSLAILNEARPFALIKNTTIISSLCYVENVGFL